VNYYRIHDSSSAGTALPASPNPTLNAIETIIKDVWKQGVIDVGTVGGDRNRDVAFDANTNGSMDFYWTGGNPELNALDTLLPGNKRVAYMKKVRINYRLSASANMGDTFIDLAPAFGTRFICPGDSIKIGIATGAGDEYDVSTVVGSRVNLTAALGENHPMANHTLYFDVAGLSGDPLLVTDAGSELDKTIAHELLHDPAIGALGDLAVSAKDNIMFFSAGSTDILMRKRETTHRYSSGPCGTGTVGKDTQWDLIPR
jgi:hypothetical protein